MNRRGLMARHASSRLAQRSAPAEAEGKRVALDRRQRTLDAQPAVSLSQ